MDRMTFLKRIEDKLKEIYQNEFKREYMEQFSELIQKWEQKHWRNNEPLSEKNVYLITYGDAFFEDTKPTLQTLHQFLQTFGKNRITDVHLLPMFPYTSDDGFSVVDYRKIHPKLGDWNDLKALAKDFRLMFDFVANHISKSSDWFQGFVNDDPKYENFFIEKDPSFDTSHVIRPRTSPLFHQYEGKEGTKTVWTTFSEDQIDLNVRHFPVLVEMTDILLEYAFKGASSIRLDAIGFLWKKSGTTCMHLSETHAIIQLWRLVLDYFKEGTQIITETNVPHHENIRYFGNGENEAHMVYQFSLPPLVLYSFTTGNAKKLTDWAKNIDKISDKATYFNFLASHDGIGMRPTEGILTEAEKNLLVDKVIENGGKVSYKTNPDGTTSVYELNINYFDALINKQTDRTETMQVQKMIAAHSILLSVMGVPAIYYHSYIGSRNDYQGLKESGINRRINREKVNYAQLVKELEKEGRRKTIYSRLNELIDIRRQQSAFSPFAKQNVLYLADELFAIERWNEQTDSSITCIVNVTADEKTIDTSITGVDLISKTKINGTIHLGPYQFVWIQKK